MRNRTFLSKAALAALTASLTLLVGPSRAEDKKDFAADKGPDKVDVSAYPAEVQEDYRVFSAKCSKCHTLARPINTDLTADAWKMYVKRMSNKPDSGISQDQGKRIYSFLKFFQGEKDAKRPAK
jgi:cytochrome c5